MMIVCGGDRHSHMMQSAVRCEGKAFGALYVLVNHLLLCSNRREGSVLGGNWELTLNTMVLPFVGDVAILWLESRIYASGCGHKVDWSCN
jgi:hypothetical protein